MLTIPEAFDKYRGRLETTDTENAAASRRQRRLRDQLGNGFSIADDFLTGAYRRQTKTKPLRDVDIMIVLTDRSYLDRHPRCVLDDVKAVLDDHYDPHRVVSDRRAVRVDFGVAIVDDVSDDVVSFDVVPAFTDGDYYLIPDDVLGVWVATNPKVHGDKATAANKAFAGRWKPVVKMIKKWNDHNGSPIEPSFLIEVMALDLISGEWSGSYPYEIRQFFATAADRIADGWPDPAGVGPDVSDVLDADPTKMHLAQAALHAAEKACTEAIRLQARGRTGDALAAWQTLFGPLFARS